MTPAPTKPSALDNYLEESDPAHSINYVQMTGTDGASTCLCGALAQWRAARAELAALHNRLAKLDETCTILIRQRDEAFRDVARLTTDGGAKDWKQRATRLIMRANEDISSALAAYLASTGGAS